MLTIKQITDNTEGVIHGLEKKHFKDAKATIEQVLAFNDKRRNTQNQPDKSTHYFKIIHLPFIFILNPNAKVTNNSYTLPFFYLSLSINSRNIKKTEKICLPLNKLQRIRKR